MNDPTLVRLTRVIQQGWPESGKDLPNDVKVYFLYRFELHIVNGVLFLQNRVVIPIGLRRQFLNKIHNAHLGVVKSKLLARDFDVLAQLEQWHQKTMYRVQHM